MDQETKNKLRRFNTGKKHSEETKARIRAGVLRSLSCGHPQSQETRNAISRARTGFRHSEETKARMRENIARRRAAGLPIGRPKKRAEDPT
jgi:hypothetical protein